MTDTTADTPRDRLVLFVRAVTAQRTGGGDGVVFAAAAGRVEYADRSVTLDLAPDERERLDALLAEYPVFKYEQPATRKAPEGVVVLSAIADAKHLADFLESVFRDVFDAPEGYELRTADG